MHETIHLLEKTDFPKIYRSKIETLQVNLGYLCNQSCTHCHVDAGPNRTEMMTAENINTVADYMQAQDISTVDLTGGAPELHSQFRELVKIARSQSVHVIDRCNLTILEEPNQEDLAEFLAEHEVEIVASLPCYLEENVDKQRGKGVFGKSIRGLQELNKLGYGKGNNNLKLTLVYNPQGPQLPPSQESLQKDYTKFLAEKYGISFDHLFTITNMPIKRFGSMLVSKGKFDEYMQLLRDAYSVDNLQSLMCRSTISVDWQGFVYDCDFNQMLGMSLPHNDKIRTHLSEIMNSNLEKNEISIANHCYGCTAGQGSSCGGALN
ncbi:MAG: radical SAM/Cys-rich domain protein [Gammaproteobacteria bacterium]|nr:MAG: radical SAM/Cys-rich domain protein [Gammaproteobacteria bacterium]